MPHALPATGLAAHAKALEAAGLTLKLVSRVPLPFKPIADQSSTKLPYTILFTLRADFFQRAGFYSSAYHVLALGLGLAACQLYFDFSGYSDIAVGLARMLGFELMRNFRLPLLASSFPDFWRRWHISLYDGVGSFTGGWADSSSAPT